MAKYGLEVVLDVNRCQVLKVAGNGIPLPGGSVAPAGSDASSVAAGWLALSVRQNSAAVGERMPPPFAVPSVR